MFLQRQPDFPTYQFLPYSRGNIYPREVNKHNTTRASYTMLQVEKKHIIFLLCSSCADRYHYNTINISFFLDVNGIIIWRM